MWSSSMSRRSGPTARSWRRRKGRRPQAGQKATQLDVAVNVPGQAFIRGRGLDSEWKGNLKVTGPLADPHIVGALNVVRGNFKFAGRTFGLDRGQISFQGGSKIDPELNLQATYSVTDLKAMVNVTGPSSSPNVKLSSTPGLPQDEILSRILFGSSVADLSPLQAVQLADAVRGLGKPGGGLLGSARSVIGLDVLQIGSSSQAGSGLEATTITGGKYIAKNVYLEVETAAERWPGKGRRRSRTDQESLGREQCQPATGQPGRPQMEARLLTRVGLTQISIAGNILS